MPRTPLWALIVASALLMSAAYAQPAPGALPSLAPGQSLGLALGMPTVPNLRDGGGYQTRDGKTVARGIAYRSDTFNPMSAGEIEKLSCSR